MSSEQENLLTSCGPGLLKNEALEVLDNISNGYYFLNTDWEFTFVNDAAVNFFTKSREKLIGEYIWNVFPEYIDTDLSDALLKVHDEQTPHTLEVLSEYSVEEYVELNILPAENGISVLFVINQKENETVKLYDDKLEIIGKMAAGVAHEVKNPLTTIKGFLQLMTNEESAEDFQSKVTLIVSEMDRINGILTEFLDVAKEKPRKLNEENLNEIIQNLYPLLETRGIKEGKSIQLELNEIPALKVDKNEIRQLLLNMVNNALDAMNSGKTVIIRTTMDNGNVVLSIIDEGKGIPQEIMDDIQHSFFTTKENGNGLGLPICYSIAEKNNAEIDYTSSSKGTSFHIRFFK